MSIKKAKWAVIGATLFMYVLVVLLFNNNFYWKLSAYMIIGYVFGNWAGREERKDGI